MDMAYMRGEAYIYPCAMKAGDWAALKRLDPDF